MRLRTNPQPCSNKARAAYFPVQLIRVRNYLPAWALDDDGDDDDYDDDDDDSDSRGWMLLSVKPNWC